MKDTELLNNFKAIRKSLEDLNKMVLLVVNVFYDVDDCEGGSYEKDIADVAGVTTRQDNNYRGYLG